MYTTKITVILCVKNGKKYAKDELENESKEKLSLDTDRGLVFAATEGDDAFDHGKDSVVTAHTYAGAWFVLGAALAKNDLTGVNDLATRFFQT